MHGRAVAEGARALGLHPFAGVRYRGDADEVLARTMVPPDSWEGTAAPGRDDPHHVSHLLDGLFAPDAADATPAADLDTWLDADVVGRDDPAVYVYRRADALGATRGLLGAMDLSGGLSARLLPHEDVRPGLVVRQREAVRALRGQVDPIVAVAAEPGDPSSTRVSPLAALLERWTRPPATWHAEADGVRHELWVVVDPGALIEAREVATGPVLVADGHHRLRAWSGSTPAWGLVWVVDADDEPLRLGAVHRVVPSVDLDRLHRLPRISADPVPDEDAAIAAVTGTDGPRAVLVQGDRWVLVRPGDGAVPPDCTTPDEPTCWLHQRWLPAWDVDDASIRYVHGAASAVDLAHRTGGAAVLLPAPSLQEVRTAAASGTMLPAKATSFAPKPRMGLVMRHWSEPGDDVAAEPAHRSRRV